MPKKVVSASEEFTKGKDFDFQEGRVRFDKVYSTIDQADFKKTGKPTRFCVVRVEFTQFDTEGNELPGQEFTHFDLKVGDAQPPDADKFHPGNIESADAEDVDDLGNELEVQGNTLVSMDGKGPSDKSKYAMFVKSMEDAGFRSDVLRNTYFPDWEGFECDLATEVLPPNFYGAPKPGETARTNKRLIVVKNDNIKFPYEQKKAAKPAAKSAAKPAAKSAAVASKAATPAPAVKPAAEDNPIQEILISMAATKAGKQLDHATLRRSIQTILVRDYDLKPNQLKGALAPVDDLDSLAKIAESAGATFDVENATITFPEE